MASSSLRVLLSSCSISLILGVEQGLGQVLAKWPFSPQLKQVSSAGSAGAGVVCGPGVIESLLLVYGCGKDSPIDGFGASNNLQGKDTVPQTLGGSRRIWQRGPVCTRGN